MKSCKTTRTGDSGDSDFPVDSASEDASYVPQKRKNAAKSSSTRKKKKLQLDSTAEDSTEPTHSFHSPHPRSSHFIDSPAPIRDAILDWYANVQGLRRMPWRKPFDPTLGPEERAQRAYEVWVSEMMLQQTQVTTVIPYYDRWIQKFPTIRDLANSNIDEVNALWKGLGYYSRASRLLEGAKKAVSVFNSRLPDNAKEMEAHIPGVGRYSAGAICSIAYNEEVPVLDGNVHRLLSRFLALHSPPKAKSTLDILWAAAKALVEIGAKSSSNGLNSDKTVSRNAKAQYAGDLNQGLIELGSTVCKVRQPACKACPLKSWCAAYRQATTGGSPEKLIDIEDACGFCEPMPSYEGVTSYPMKVDRKKAREELDLVSVIEWRASSNSKDRRFLFVRRPEGGLLAGLYEFPTSPDVAKDLTPSAKQIMGKELLSQLVEGATPLLSSTLPTKIDVEADTAQSNLMFIAKVLYVGDVVHVFSHIRKTYSVQWILLEGGVCPPQLTLDPCGNDKPRKGRARKGKNRDIKAVSEPPPDVSPIAMWVPFGQVLSTNMGSGVVKVWNLVRELWER